jgi:hypothetical protein
MAQAARVVAFAGEQILSARQQLPAASRSLK